MPSFGSRLAAWNRRFHYYLGLYFLFFLWLFSATGLMLNHQSWFRNLYARTENAYQLPIETPAGDTLLDETRHLMKQLELTGEIEWPASQPIWHIDFTVARPDGASQVRADLSAKKAYIREFTNGHLHTFQVFHTFSGSRFNQPASERDWIVTSVWVLAMDALAAGLVVMVLGSYYMWWQLKKSHTLGFVVLAAAFAACGAFVAGAL